MPPKERLCKTDIVGACYGRKQLRKIHPMLSGKLCWSVSLDMTNTGLISANSANSKGGTWRTFLRDGGRPSSKLGGDTEYHRHK